jgi:hypothetical protein
MDVDFVLRGTLDNSVSDDLRVLQDYLHDADVACTQVVMEIPHVKEPITIGLAIAGLAVSTFSAVLSAVNVWNSHHPKYSVTVHAGENSYQISNLGRAELTAIAKSLGTSPIEQAVILRITRRDSEIARRGS